MKKKTLLYVICLLAMTTTSAQAIYQQGDNVISAGLGLGSSFGGFGYHVRQSPAINLQYERGIWQAGTGVISLGGYAGYKTFSYTDTYYGGYTYREKWRYTIIGLRSAWHWQEMQGKAFEKWDLYGGLMLSYNLLQYTYADDDPYFDYDTGNAYGSAVGFTGFIGSRYFFKERFAMMAEAGFGISFLNLGIAYRF